MSASLAEAEDCVICFDRPDMYGLLQNCNHQFCLTCIRHWRKSNETPQAQPRRVAPTDAELRSHYLHNIMEEDLRARRNSQAAMAERIPHEAPRDEYREAMAALEAGTFELGPNAPVNRDRAARLRRTPQTPSDPIPTTSLPGWTPTPQVFPFQVEIDSPDAHEDETKMRNTKACPLCREPSQYVIPAARFPKDSVEKEQLIKGFFAEKKRTLCRDFEKSLESVEGYYCPRFNDCAYAHLKAASSPDSHERDEPFTFTEERIQQMKSRRNIAAASAAFFGDADAPGALPPHVYEHISQMLANMPSEMDDLDYEVLIADFMECYHNHMLSLGLYAQTHQRPELFLPGEQDYSHIHANMIFPVHGHVLRYYDASGQFLRTSDGYANPATEAREHGLKEWRDRTIQFRDHGLIVCCYLAPIGAQFEATQIHNDFIASVAANNVTENRRLQQEWDHTSNTNERHLYHLYTEDGEYLDLLSQADQPISDDYPTHIEFIPAVAQTHALLGEVKHHFLSPLSIDEANEIIATSPDFGGLQAAIISQADGSIESRLTPWTQSRTSRGGGLAEGPFGGERFPPNLSFMPPGVTMNDLLEQMADLESAGEDYEQDHDWENEEDYDDDESDSMPGLVPILPSDEDDAWESDDDGSDDSDDALDLQAAPPASRDSDDDGIDLAFGGMSEDESVGHDGSEGGTGDVELEDL